MKRGTPVFPLAAALITVLFASSALAHGGGLDAKGCHTEKRTGEYHCHRAQDTQKRENPQAGSVYDRKEWHPRWRDSDRDCQKTRDEVLAEESQVPVTLSPDKCRVIAGKWLDPYSGKIFTDPQNLDIDHLVPLKEAHIGGGSAWSTEKKRRYANDLSYPATLIAVSSRENRSKGARDPASWLPSNCAYHCEYVRSWKEVKARWELGSDAAENRSIEDIERRCRQANLRKP